MAGKENFRADFNLGKHLLQLTDRHQAPGQGTHALHLLSCIQESVPLQRGVPWSPQRTTGLGPWESLPGTPAASVAFPACQGSLWIGRGKQMDCGLSSDTGGLLDSSVLTKPEVDAPQGDQISPTPTPCFWYLLGKKSRNFLVTMIEDMWSRAVLCSFSRSHCYVICL